MADIVWSTLELYGIQNKIMAIMMDNASNNDTMMDAIEARCLDVGIDFSATQARMRCMPHTIHLACIKLLEGIGLITKETGKRASSSRENYQDNINASLDREDDKDAAPEDDDDPQDAVSADPSEKIQTAVQKLRKIVRSVRSSPQRRQSWLKEVARMNPGKPGLMLILDVKTRWSSTHQMLRMAHLFFPLTYG
ncbi:hypothetical protein FPV67DRAFT_1560685 [Lyophyllum atratum]|nr:hypothetical protein FPV67DRAFT_1560685 [Lyophyllum atratum]